MSVMEAEARLHAGELVAGTLPDSSMLAMVVGQRHRATVWERYVARIGAILTEAVPRMCQTEAPANELRLQEMCDGALAGHQMQLRREYPFLRWGSVRPNPTGPRSNSHCG